MDLGELQEKILTFVSANAHASAHTITKGVRMHRYPSRVINALNVLRAEGLIVGELARGSLVYRTSTQAPIVHKEATTAIGMIKEVLAKHNKPMIPAEIAIDLVGVLSKHEVAKQCSHAVRFGRLGYVHVDNPNPDSATRWSRVKAFTLPNNE